MITMKNHGPATVAEQVHKMITIMSLEKTNALQEIESKCQLHSKWLKEITEASTQKVLNLQVQNSLSITSCMSLIFLSLIIAWYFQNP
jgi:hypothetical protein